MSFLIIRQWTIAVGKRPNLLSTPRFSYFFLRRPSFVKACLLGRVVRTPPHKTGPSPQVIREFLLRSHAIDLYPRDDDGRVLDFRNWTHGEESKQALSLLPYVSVFFFYALTTTKQRTKENDSVFLLNVGLKFLMKSMPQGNGKQTNIIQPFFSKLLCLLIHNRR